MRDPSERTDPCRSFTFVLKNVNLINAYRAVLKMIARKEILKQLQELKPVLQRDFGLTEIALFGSSARNENKMDSDIDLLIDLSKNTSSDFFNIAFQLKDLFHPVKVDIVTKKGVKPAYFKSIEKDLIYV
jgi:predicted nucleotidyltransferase